MNTLFLMTVGAAFWLLCVGVAVGFGHWLTERGWRRRADARAFDAMIDAQRAGSAEAHTR